MLEELPKERHEQPMLSLDKTKEVEVLKDFVGAHKVLLSWKMDGLTVVLTYREGTLLMQSHAETVRSGKLSQTMPEFLKMFRLRYHIRASWFFRGEAVISYENFEKINEEIADVDGKIQKSAEICAVGPCVS